MVASAPLPARAPDLCASAVSYAAAGFPVLALRPGLKVPATAHGFHDATTDVRTLAELWRRYPLANVGIAIPAGFVVIDIDDPAALHRLAAEGVELPATVTAGTPRGCHYWYSLPAGVSLSPGVAVLGPGVDTRAAGSYVVAPPSTVDGRSYIWRVALSFDSIAPIPAALLTRLRARRAPVATSSPGARRAVVPLRFPARIDPMQLLIDGAPKGQRNAQLFRAACALRRLGASLAVLTEYSEAVAANCSPPLPLTEARRIAASAARYEPDSEAAK